MSSRLSHEIKAEALRLGFSACGIARAEPVDEATAAAFREWLQSGGHATMQYMENYEDKRLDPRLLMPGVKSIISGALNYTPETPVKGFANYAIGKDYHDIVKQKLQKLAQKITPHQLPRGGEIEDAPCRQHCGNCHRCIDACPTGALAPLQLPPKGGEPQTANQKASPIGGGREGASFNGALCLSYLTIENRGDIPEEAAQKMGETFYGCDRCQQVCPWNAKAKPTDEPLLQPTAELLSMKDEDWQQLSVEQYRKLFKGSAVKRAKYEGLMRNIKAIRNEQDK